MPLSAKKRIIVKINEDLCNGCGQCISSCAEGALALVNGKARVVKDELCDGAGFCLGACPTGALSLEEREAADFNPAAAEQALEVRNKSYVAQKCSFCNITEDNAFLLPIKNRGKSLWVCVKCLPSLIHGRD